LSLYDFYYAMARKLRALEAREMQLENDERVMLGELRAILSDDDPKSFLASLLDVRRSSTGDAKVDEWYAALDRGEVPAEFWGEKGRPEKPKKREGQPEGAKIMSWAELSAMMAEEA
jgi:hypothetical protein